MDEYAIEKIKYLIIFNVHLDKRFLRIIGQIGN